MAQTFRPELEQMAAKLFGREAETPEMRAFVSATAARKAGPALQGALEYAKQQGTAPTGQAAQPDNRDDRYDKMLTALEKKAADLDQRSGQLFTVEMQQKLQNMIQNTPGLRQQQASRKQLAGEEQTRFQSELSGLEPSETADPLVQLDVASQSRARVSEALQDTRSAIEAQGGFAKDVVNQFLTAEAQRTQAGQDQFDRQRQLLADTLSVDRERRVAAGGGSGAATAPETGDETELINLALDNMSEEERRQLELLPTASRKTVLIERGRQIKKQKERAAATNAQLGLQPDEQFNLGGTIIQAGLNLVTGQPINRDTIQTTTAKPAGKVSGLDDINSLDDL